MDEGLALLAALTDIPSPTGDADGIARKASLCARRLEALGLSVERPDPGGVPTLVARGPSPPVSGRRPALLVTHLDTVLGAPAWPFAWDPAADRATGPGVADPVGGVTVLIRALERLAQSGDLQGGAWVVVLNGDEEVGSPNSAALLQELAAGCAAGFVFESARQNGDLVGRRAGNAHWLFEARGIAAHAGVNPSEGASAVVALARLIVAAEELSAPDRGLSVTVGTVRGGVARNQVPERAEAEVDVRFRTAADGEGVGRALEAAAREAALRVPGAQVRAVRQRGRPAWPGGHGTDALCAHWRAAAADLGQPVPVATATGGGSDANILASAGLPCLDGLGAVGGGYHTRAEWVRASSVEARAALTAAALRRWQAAHDF